MIYAMVNTKGGVGKPRRGAIVQELGKDPSSSQEMEAFLAEVTA